MDMLIVNKLNLNLKPLLFWAKSSIMLNSSANERKQFSLFALKAFCNDERPDKRAGQALLERTTTWQTPASICNFFKDKLF